MPSLLLASVAMTACGTIFKEPEPPSPKTDFVVLDPSDTGIDTGPDTGVDPDTDSGVETGIDTGDAPVVLFERTSGLQTHPEELDRFASLVTSHGGQYAADLANLTTNATGAQGSQWSYALTPGEWVSASGACVPAGAKAEDAYEIREAATDIWALALSGYLNGDESAYDEVRTHLLEFAAIDFPATPQDGSNACALDLGSAAFHLFESAWLLESAHYAGWTEADKHALAGWAVDEVIPVTSFGIARRKNNWGIVMMGSTLAAANFVAGAYPQMTLYDGSVTSPEAYLDTADEQLRTWLSAKSSTALDSECDEDHQVLGLQAHGGFPDELRRTGGTSNCNQPSIDFACSSESDCGSAFNYQQKATNGMTRVCEIFRRMDGDGARCFDLQGHGGENPSLVDAIRFSIGGDLLKPTYPVRDVSQAIKYVAGQYYQASCIVELPDDNNGSYARGGRDFAYTRLTHAPGVAYTHALLPCE